MALKDQPLIQNHERNDETEHDGDYKRKKHRILLADDGRKKPEGVITQIIPLGNKHRSQQDRSEPRNAEEVVGNAGCEIVHEMAEEGCGQDVHDDGHKMGRIIV